MVISQSCEFVVIFGVFVNFLVLFPKCNLPFDRADRKLSGRLRFSDTNVTFWPVGFRRFIGKGAFLHMVTFL